jgi:hypothetical protein
LENGADINAKDMNGMMFIWLQKNCSEDNFVEAK